MTVSVRIRFEVFKRDRFTCRYCGQTPPQVLLELDHVIPQAAGGSDEIANLVTSCQECNRGKSDKLLEEGVAPPTDRTVTAELRERIEQAQAYLAAIGDMEDLKTRQYWIFIEHWTGAFGGEIGKKQGTRTFNLLPGQEWPNDRTIRLFLRRLPLEVILDAIDTTASRFGGSDFNTCRYFYAICWRRIKDRGADW